MQIVLMYHDVYVDSYDESGFLKESTKQYKISVEVFEKHVKAVSEYCKTNKDVDVMFTFDDGGKSFATVITPVLEKYGLKGIFFISAKYIGEESFVSFDQIEDMKRRGHIIGSHSYSHPNLASLTGKAIKEEWRKSIEILHPYLENDICASIPEGYSSETVIESAAENGISVLYTSEPTTMKVQKKGMTIIGRFVVYEGMTTDDVMSIVTSGKRRWMLRTKWQFINCVKLILGKKYEKVKACIYKRTVRE